MHQPNKGATSNPDPDREAREESFVALITRHQTTLLAYLLALVPNPPDAEDILQRANVVIWRKRDQFEPGTNFRAWAFSVSRWEALAFFKERKRENWLVFDEGLAGLVGDKLAAIPDGESDAMLEALRNCLGRLSDSHRGMILDRYQSGRSLKDCAKRFNRSENGLKVTLHRIRIELRRCISHQLGTHPA